MYPPGWERVLALAGLGSISVHHTRNALEGRNMKVFSVLFVLLLASPVLAQNEDVYNDAFCASVGGQREVRHNYTFPTGESYVIVDCETEGTVYEGGLDKRSSLDSIQQAVFFAYLTGKEPAVVVYDTDGKMGRFEYRIQMACGIVGVEFLLSR